MTTPTRKRRLNPEAKRALKLLAGNSRGVTEAFALAQGFTRTMLTGLVRARLATVQHEALKCDSAPIKFERYRITAAGWTALEALLSADASVRLTPAEVFSHWERRRCARRWLVA